MKKYERRALERELALKNYEVRPGSQSHKVGRQEAYKVRASGKRERSGGRTC